MNDYLFVLNCGSSSIKFALFDARDVPPARTPVWSGKLEGIATSARFTGFDGSCNALELDPDAPYRAALSHVLSHVTERLANRGIAAVIHRVVHGGPKYFSATRIDDAVLADLRSYIAYAPLHQSFAVEAIDMARSLWPDMPQIACFDTGFHQTLPRTEQMLALPYSAWERGLRRYGFHGLSYQYIALATQERHPAIAHGRMIAAHLGNGASLCGMRDLRSVATTMGFSALDGLMMGTRCGAIDPGALIYLMETEKTGLQELIRMLYQESGLLGISGISSDPRVLLQQEADHARARDALALYVRSIVREIGALVALLGGVDLLIFTAGVGEHNAEIRARVLAQLAFLGIAVDKEANLACRHVISAPGSRVLVGVEPTNEEWIAAMQAGPLLSASTRSA